MNEQQYYAEAIEAIPFEILYCGLKQQVPAPVAGCIAACFRLRHRLGWPLAPLYAFGSVEAECVVDASGLPSRARSKWAGIVEELGDLGFSHIEYSIPDLVGAKQGASALHLDESGCTLATVEWMRMRASQGIEEHVVVEFNSYFEHGFGIMTARTPDEHQAFVDALKLEFVDQYVMSEHTLLRALYEKHLTRIGSRIPDKHSRESASIAHSQHSQRRFNALLDKGMIRQLKSREVHAVKSRTLPR